jgi:hypothetical protein
MSEITNAVISKTMLGREDHGIMTCYLTLDYSGSVQGFGGYSLDEFSPTLDRRVGTKWGMEFIARVLNVVEVENWEDLRGKYVRVKKGGATIDAIGHITKDQWFDPKVDLAFLVERSGVQR